MGRGAQRVLRVHVKGWWLVLGRVGSVVGEGTDASQRPQARGRRRRPDSSGLVPPALPNRSTAVQVRSSHKRRHTGDAGKHPGG